MTISQPPRFAARLLKRLVPGQQDHDVLIGDLNEEYHRGRSKTWYLLQILAAIVVGSLKNVRRHWFLSLRAIAIGVATFLAYFYVVGDLFLNHTHMIAPPGLAGAFVLIWAFFLVGSGLSGWAIVRCNREYGLALALPFAALMCALALSEVVSSVLTPRSLTLWEAGGLVVKLLGIPASIVIGGYRATRRAGAA